MLHAAGRPIYLSAMAELGPGTVFAGHRIEAVAGRGGMGVVYRAKQLALDRTVALKVIAAGLLDDQTMRNRFVRESKVAASIDHPNVIPIYYAGEEDGIAYLAMQHPARPLGRHARLRRARADPRRPDRRAGRRLRVRLLGLLHAHRRGAQDPDDRYPSAGDLARAAVAAAAGRTPDERERLVAKGAAAPIESETVTAVARPPHATMTQPQAERLRLSGKSCRSVRVEPHFSPSRCSAPARPALPLPSRSTWALTRRRSARQRPPRRAPSPPSRPCVSRARSPWATGPTSCASSGTTSSSAPSGSIA